MFWLFELHEESQRKFCREATEIKWTFTYHIGLLVHRALVFRTIAPTEPMPLHSPLGTYSPITVPFGTLMGRERPQVTSSPVKSWTGSKRVWQTTRFECAAYVCRDSLYVDELTSDTGWLWRERWYVLHSFGNLRHQWKAHHQWRIETGSV